LFCRHGLLHRRRMSPVQVLQRYHRRRDSGVLLSLPLLLRLSNHNDRDIGKLKPPFRQFGMDKRLAHPVSVQKSALAGNKQFLACREAGTQLRRALTSDCQPEVTQS